MYVSPSPETIVLVCLVCTFHMSSCFSLLFSTSYLFCSSSYRLMSTLLLPLGFKIDPLYSILPIAIFSYVLPEIQYNGVSSPKAQESLFLRLYLLIFRFALMPSMLLWFIQPSLPLIESLHAPPPLIRTQSLRHLKYLWHFRWLVRMISFCHFWDSYLLMFITHFSWKHNLAFLTLFVHLTVGDFL